MNLNNTLYLNRIRIFASLFVIIIHVCALFFYSYPVNSQVWIISTFYNCLARAAVPLFVFVSGAIYLNEDKQITLKKIFLSIFRFVVIFFIWDFLYLCVDSFVINGITFTFTGVINIVKNIINYKYHLWYILSYITLLALTPILRLICKKENKKQVKYLLLLFFICTCVIQMVNFLLNLCGGSSYFIKLIQYFLGVIDLVNIGKITNLIILFISGWYFSVFEFKNEIKWVRILKWGIGILVPIITIILCLHTNKNGFEAISNYYFLPNYILTICIFLSFRYSKLSNKKNKFFDLVGNNTFCIYLVHVLIIDLIYKFFNVFLVNNCKPIWLIFIIPIYVIITYLLSLLFSMLINILPKKIKRWIC